MKHDAISQRNSHSVIFKPLINFQKARGDYVIGENFTNLKGFILNLEEGLFVTFKIPSYEPLILAEHRWRGKTSCTLFLQGTLLGIVISKKKILEWEKEGTQLRLRRCVWTFARRNLMNISSFSDVPKSLLSSAKKNSQRFIRGLR